MKFPLSDQEVSFVLIPFYTACSNWHYTSMGVIFDSRGSTTAACVTIFFHFILLLTLVKETDVMCSGKHVTCSHNKNPHHAGTHKCACMVWGQNQDLARTVVIKTLLPLLKWQDICAVNTWDHRKMFPNYLRWWWWLDGKQFVTSAPSLVYWIFYILLCFKLFFPNSLVCFEFCNPNMDPQSFACFYFSDFSPLHLETLWATPLFTAGSSY